MKTKAEERAAVKASDARYTAKWKARKVARESIVRAHEIQREALQQCTNIWRGSIQPGDAVWVLLGSTMLVRVKVTRTQFSGRNLLCYHSGAGADLPPGWEGMDLIPTCIGNAVAAAAGQSDAAVIMLNNDLRDVMRDAGIAWIAELASAE
jgi:hypothetical protein